MKAAIRHGANVNTMEGLWGLTLPGSLDGFCPYLRVEHLDADVTSEQFTLCNGRVTPLILAAGAGYLDLVSCLLRHGANIDRAGFMNLTPLIVAAQGGYPDVVELLLQSGADPTLIHGMFMTALGLAVEGDCVSAAVDPNYPEPYPVITRVASDGYIDVVQKLLDHGTNVEIKSRDVDGATPLMYAAWVGSVKACGRLIDLGADVGAKDRYGRGTLWWALRHGNGKIDTMLSERSRVGESMI